MEVTDVSTFYELKQEHLSAKADQLPQVYY